MIKPNSTADFFLKYFRYKLSVSKTLPILSAILGLLSFVQLSAVILVKASGVYDLGWRYEYFTYSTTIFCIALVIMSFYTILTALTSFDFFLCKHRTDMLGSLPLTHSMRFWGDFISGYAISVLPFFLLSAISVPIVSAAADFLQSQFFVKYYFYVVITVFFALTLLYVIGAAAASICGKRSGAAACAIIFIIASIYLIPCIAGFFTNSITGYNNQALYDNSIGLTPSPLVAFNTVKGFFEKFLPIDSNTDYDAVYLENISAVYAAKMPNMLIWILETIFLAAGAFFLTKFRKTERTGNVFGHKYGYYAVLFGTVFIAESMIFGSFFGLMTVSFSVNFSERLISSAILCTVIFLAFEISMRRGRKNFAKGAAVYAGSFAVISGFMLIIDCTGTFGLKYKLPELNDIEYVETIGIRYTESEDIEQFRKNHAKLLEEYGNKLTTGGISFEYKLKDGTSFIRSYTPQYRLISDGGGYEKCSDAIDRVITNVGSYKSKNSQKILSEGYTECTVWLKDVFGGITIKPEKINEFLKVFTDEYKSAGDAKSIGNIDLRKNVVNADFFSLNENYTKTLEFIKDKRNVIVPEIDEETVCYRIYFYRSDYDKVNYNLYIRKKDLENEKVKELISLLVEEDEISGKIADNIVAEKNDSTGQMYVLAENLEKINRLAREIIAEKLFES